MALDIEEMEWTIEDQLQLEKVNSGDGDRDGNGDSELSELNSSQFEDKSFRRNGYKRRSRHCKLL